MRFSEFHLYSVVSCIPLVENWNKFMVGKVGRDNIN